MSPTRGAITAVAVIVAACTMSGSEFATASPLQRAGGLAVTASDRPVLSKKQAIGLLAGAANGSIGGLRYSTHSYGEYWLPVRDYIPAARQQIPAGLTPASCAATGVPAVLLDGDRHVAHSAIYRIAGATFSGGITPTQTIRIFPSAAAAEASYRQYESALRDCEQIVVPGSPGYRIDRRYGAGPVADSFKTLVVQSIDGSGRSVRQVQYTARVANAVVTFWGDDATKKTRAVLKALVEHAKHRARSVR